MPAGVVVPVNIAVEPSVPVPTVPDVAVPEMKQNTQGYQFLTRFSSKQKQVPRLSTYMR